MELYIKEKDEVIKIDCNVKDLIDYLEAYVEGRGDITQSYSDDKEVGWFAVEGYSIRDEEDISYILEETRNCYLDDLLEEDRNLYFFITKNKLSDIEAMFMFKDIAEGKTKLTTI